jgi:hypothetical protein
MQNSVSELLDIGFSPFASLVTSQPVRDCVFSSSHARQGSLAGKKFVKLDAIPKD